MKTVIAVYSITMGVAILTMWTALWAMGAIPEMITKPWEIAMHLTAEFTTAGLLVISGIGLWLETRWATRVNVFASGMLVYTLIQCPGYYRQRREGARIRRAPLRSFRNYRSTGVCSE